MKARWLLLVLACLVACGASARRLVAPLSYAPAPPAPEEPFRAAPPRGGPLEVAPAAEPSKTWLNNGMEVLLLQRRGLPVLAAALVVSRGSRDLPGAPRSELLAVGVDGLVREHQSGPGAATDVEPSAWCRADGCVISVTGLSGALERAIQTLADIAVAPRYPVAAEPRLRAEWTGWMSALRDRTEGMVDNNARALLFGPDDPYAPVTREVADDLGGVSVLALRHLHERLFQPAHAALVVAGDVTPDALRAAAERAFGGWRATKPPLPMAAATSPIPERVAGTVLVDSPSDLVHACLVGRAPAGNEPALDAMSLLGESLTAPMGRLHDEVRQDLGAGYDLHFALHTGRTGSWFLIGGAFEPSVALPAITAVVDAVRKVRVDGLSAADLEAARTRAMVRIREEMGTSAGAVSAMSAAILNGAPPAALLARQAHIAALTGDEVRRFAQVWLAEPMLRVVVVGPRDRLAQPFGTLGLGPMEWRGRSGERLR